MPDSDLVTFDHLSEPRSGSTPAEVYRAVFPGRTPSGELSTVIVTRQGVGPSGRVWLTFNGALRTTVEMTNPETTQLCAMLHEATAYRRPKTGQGA